MPDVTVIIPVWNTGEYLREAVESIEPALGELEGEVILVDDHSTSPNTVDVIRDLQSSFQHVRAVQNQHGKKGAGSARNSGVELATSNWITFLDSDDVYLAGSLQERVSIANSRDVSWVSSDFVKWYPAEPLASDGYFASNASDYPLPAAAYRSGATKFVDTPVSNLILDKMPVNTSTAMVRKSAFSAAGGFGEEIQKAEDTLLWLKLAHYCKGFAFIPKVHSKYRVRDDSLTHEDKASGFWIADMLKVLYRNDDFGTFRRDIKQKISHSYNRDSHYYRSRHQWGRAFRDAARAAYWDPKNLRAWKNMTAALVGRE